MEHERYMHMHGGGKPSMKKASFDIALKDRSQIAKGTMAFVFEKPQGFAFKAGQHLRMTLINPPETDSEGNSRFLSLASTPQDPDIVIAMRMRDTAFKRVLENMRIGEKVRIQVLLDVPHGAFALHDDPSKPAVFIVGGIGIVPAFSMIKDAIGRKSTHQMFLFYSNRRPEDAPFLDDLQRLAEQNPHFTLIATMTEAEKSAERWSGETGVIDHAMLTKHVRDLQLPIYYVSGLPGMASTMKKMLTDAGVPSGNIKAEEFEGFDLNTIEDASSHGWKKYVLLAAIVVAVIGIGISHVTAADSIADVFSLENPLFYILLGVMLVIIPFKFKHGMSLIRGLKKK